ncbi:Flagellin protein FlaA [Desulfurella amilsii]|uniref:Flagellin n=1 Tax=Desulfurella amilsii TaxID=1562698 RepID=A0A1X4XYQ2_9BACT|nr:flagellin [Desulfurella amilsii]OSS42658.1 Flagellin protein FlaA [Desulfurella amilsii]
MSLQINTNIAALQSINTLNNNSTQLTNALNSLSTGLRLTSAAVDPAGMTIADSLNFQSTNLGQAISNGSDTVNLINIADQALQQSISLVTNIAQQATQAANATQDSSSRQALQNNINGLLSEINNIASTTSYKGINLLNGGFTNKIVQIGAYQNQTIGIGIQNTAANAIGWVANQQFSNGNTTGSASEMANAVTASTGALSTNFAGIGVSFAANKAFATIGNGDIAINGVNVNVFGTSRTQQLDAGNWSQAINAVSGQTGVSASAQTTVVGTKGIQAGTISAAGLLINGVNIGQVNVGVGDSGGNLVNAINQYTSQTGVVASVNNNGQLVLTNTTGGNIAVQSTSNTQSMLGINNTTTNLNTTASLGITTAAQSFYINGAKITLGKFAATSGIAISAANLINTQLAAAGVTGVTAIASKGTTASSIRIVANNGSDLNITNPGAAAGFLGALGLTSLAGATSGAYLANNSYHGTITLTSNNAFTVGGANNGAFDAYAGLKSGTYSPNVNLSNVNVTNQNSAGLAITIANSALSALDKIRANLGSVENQINATVQNIQVAQVNVTQAQAAITNVNFGTETSKFSTMQVLAQAGTYALAQANATQQLVLRLMQ